MLNCFFRIEEFIECLVHKYVISNHFILFFSLLGRFGKMARYKEKENDQEHNSVKCSLASVIRAGYEQLIIAVISEFSIMATRIAFLASLLLLYMVCYFIIKKDVIII